MPDAPPNPLGPASPYDPDAPPGDFSADLELTPDPERAGRFHGELSKAWNVFYTFGGITMATAARAAEAAIDRDDLDILSAHALFCAPLAAGPVVADVEVLRNGRSAAQASVDLRQDGHDGTDLRLQAVFGQRHETHVSYQGIEFPADALPPEDCPPRPDLDEEQEVRNPFPKINFHDQTDWRPALEGFTWDQPDWSSDTAEARNASWFRFLKEPRRADGTLDPISHCVPADMIGSAIGRRMGPSSPENPPFFILSLDIDVQFFAPTSSSWILQHVVSQWAGDGYGFGTTELWDEDRRLVALAAQRARLRTFTPGEAFGPG